ncbi:Trm112 family protein [Idiomarina sp. UBA3162]|uniref:Trm112 family protein n=1 Tax=unclassified Idiomarina TaxID=2614829 RepID=UPI000C97B92F|nr:Trm112 family protein [Idiomarina sp. UBA3162]MAD52710.1 hypothetical protein [Idiomarinaceae bacterium]MEC7643617.1 Trm112 family protein [Pseudomonadota bacterium]
MSFDTGLLNIIACPSCKGRLVWHEARQWLVCRGERLAFELEEGIPVLMSEKAKSLNSEEMEQVPL